MDFTFTTDDPGVAFQIIQLLNPAAPPPRPAADRPSMPEAGSAQAPQRTRFHAVAEEIAAMEAEQIARALLSRPLPRRQAALLRLFFESRPGLWLTSEDEQNHLVQAGLVAANEDARSLVRAALAAISGRMKMEFGQEPRSSLNHILNAELDSHGNARHRLTAAGRQAIEQNAAQIFNGEA